MVYSRSREGMSEKKKENGLKLTLELYKSYYLLLF